jgi:hypothetical protein
MKLLGRKWTTLLVALVTCNSLHAQSEGNDVNPLEKRENTYAGIGAGFDYGGIVGGKLEYLPAKHLGVFLATGYNLLSIGWNVGATYKFTPDKNTSPNLLLMYGYNAAFKGTDSYAERYNMTSYGWTVGINLDIRSGNRGNKWSIGFFVPFRSGKFIDNYDAAKKDPIMELKNELLPIGVSCGYNFKI